MMGGGKKKSPAKAEPGKGGGVEVKVAGKVDVKVQVKVQEKVAEKVEPQQAELQVVQDTQFEDL